MGFICVRLTFCYSQRLWPQGFLRSKKHTWIGEIHGTAAAFIRNGVWSRLFPLTKRRAKPAVSFLILGFIGGGAYWPSSTLHHEPTFCTHVQHKQWCGRANNSSNAMALI